MSGIQIDVQTKTSKSEQDLERINKSLSNIQHTTSKTSEALIGMFKGLGVAITSGFSLKYVKDVSNEFTELGNKIALVTGRTRELVAVQDKLLQLSEDTRGSLQGTVQTYSAIGRALRNQNVSSDRILKATAAIQESLALSGSSAQSAEAAIMQLGQGLASGVLRGEELNSVMEQAPRIAQAITDELGITQGKLRDIASEGKLTSDVVFRALLKQSGQINKEFSQLAPTLSQGSQLLSTSIKLYVNELDKGMGLTAAIGTGTFSVAKRIKEASKSAFDLGVQVAYTFNTFRSNAGIIGRSVGGVFKELGKQFVRMLPEGFITRTLKRDTNSSIRELDKFTGGMISKFKRFKFVDLLYVESDVERAVRGLKRLNPKFNHSSLLAYSKGFDELAKAIATNSDTMSEKLVDFVHNVQVNMRKVSRYLGFSADSLFSFKPGNMEAFTLSLAQMVRGISGARVKISDFSKTLTIELNSGLDNLKLALKDSVVAIPGAIVGAVKFAFNLVIGFMQRVIALFSDVKSTINIKDVLSGALEEFDRFWKGVEDKTDFGGAFNRIKKFAKNVIHEFFVIYDDVIGHSWWTDTVETVVETSDKLWDNAKEGFAKFSAGVKSAFQSIGHGAAEKFKALTWTIADTASNMLDGVDGGFNVLGNKLFNGFYIRDFARDIDSLHSSVGELTGYLDLLFTSIGVIAVAGLGKAYNAVKGFAKKVIHEFFVIYDDVIGHSWWTDTVETVVETSNSLWDRVSAGLQRFKSNTIGVFENIFDRAFASSFSIKDIKGLDFSFTELKLPEIKTDKLADSFVELSAKVKDIFGNLFDAFPDLAKAAMTGIAAVIVGMLFPAGVIKTTLLAGILSSLATSGTLIAEQFGVALTGGSFASALGVSLGKAAGFFLSETVKALPRIGNVLFGFIKGFVKGFTEELPVIGQLIKALFDIASGFGVEAPLGILGAALFGKGILSLMSGLDIGKDKLKSITDLFESGLKYVSGGGKGWISKVLFGNLGATRVISALFVIGDLLGTFDSVFAGSEVAHMIAQGGFLYTMLTGKDGLNNIKDLLGSKVVAPISSMIAEMGKKATAGTDLYDVFFGSIGTWPERAGVFIKATVDKITNKIIDVATPVVGKSYEFLRQLFLGKDSETTVNLLKKQFSEIFSFLALQVGKAREFLTGLNLGEAFVGAQGGAAAASGAKKAITATVLAGSQRLQEAADIAAKVGGEHGLVGRAFLGKYGKAAIVGTILSLFALGAFAQDNTNSLKDTSYSVLDDIKSNFEKLELTDPFAALAVKITAGSLPLILGALYFFRRQVGALISDAFSLSSVSKWTGGVLGAIGRVVSSMRGIITIGLAGGIGALVGNSVGGVEMALLGASLASTFATSFASHIGAAFNTVAAIIGTYISGTFAAIAAGVAIAGGILYLLFFGEKGKFWEELGRVKDKMLELIGLAPKPSDSQTGLSKDQTNFAKKADINFSYNLQDINMKRLSDTDTEKLNKQIEQLSKALDSAKDEQDATGLVSSATRDAIRALNRGLQNYTDKLAAKTASDPNQIQQMLQKYSNLAPKTRAAEFLLDNKQSQLSKEYTFRLFLMELRRSLSFSQAGKANATRDIEALKSQRDTTYNARYRELSSADKTTANLVMTARSVENSNKKFASEIERLYTLFEKAKADVQAGTWSNFSLFDMNSWAGRQLAPNDPRVVKANKIQSQLDSVARQEINNNKQVLAITAFNNALQNMESDLKSVNIAFDSSSLFAGDADAFKRLRKLSEHARQLSEDLKNTASVAEHNKIVLEIEEIRTQVTRIELEADNNSLDRKQFKLKELVDRAGGSVISEASYRLLPDDVADRLYREYKKIFSDFEKLKKRKPLAAQPVGPVAGRTMGKLLMKANDPNKEYLAEMERIRVQLRDKEKEIINEMTKGAAGLSVSKDLATAGGVDFSKMVRDMGFDKATNGVRQLTDKLQELRDAEASGSDPELITQLNKEVELLRENLTQAPMDLQTFLSGLSTAGQNVAIEDLVGISPEAFNSLTRTSAAMRNIEIQMRQMTGTVSQSRLGEIVKLKLGAARASFEAFVQTIHNTPEKIAQGLQKFGISDALETALIPPDALKQLLEIDKDITRLQNKLKDPDNVSQFQKINALLSEAQQKAVRIRATFASTSVRSDNVEKAFNLGISKEEFSKLGGDLQARMSASAFEFNSQRDRLENTPINSQADFEYVSKALAGIADAQRAAGLAFAKEFQASGVRMQVELSKTESMTLSELSAKIIDVFPALSDFREELERLGRADLVNQAKEAIRVQNARRVSDLSGDKPQDDRAAGRAYVTGVQSKLESNNYALVLRTRLKAFDIDLSAASANFIDSASKRTLEKLVSELEVASQSVKTANDDRTRIAAQNVVNAQREELEAALLAATEDLRGKSSETGKAFASSIIDGFKSSFTSLLKGEMSWKEFLKATLDNFTNNVITSFMEGLLKPFTGEDSLITKKLRELGEGLFLNASDAFGKNNSGTDTLASRAWNGVKGLLGIGSTSTTPVETADPQEAVVNSITDSTNVQKGLFETLGGTFRDSFAYMGSFIQSGLQMLASVFQSSAFSGIGQMVSKGFDWIGGVLSAGALFFSGGAGSQAPAPIVDASPRVWVATGGYITGPGTGTSDSIPAMLSNGEFVVNAKSAKEHLDLLQRINSGTVQKFAKGGSVGKMSLVQPTLKEIKPTRNSSEPSQQIFQINVTGDVSRQTRSEIQKMIPFIATNTNAYNREKRGD